MQGCLAFKVQFLCLCMVSASVRISIVSPALLQLAYPNGIPGVMSLFGEFPYGSYVFGQVSVFSSNGCGSLSASGIGSIFLLERGGCEFVDKVSNAEKAGATAVLIYDNQVENLVPMAGRPSNCGIPAVFISFTDAKAIITTDSVNLNLTFSFDGSGGSPSVSLLFNLRPERDVVINSILPTIQEVTAGATLALYYYITSCGNCSTSNSNVQKCLGGGRYCALDVSNGAQYLQEVIRQQCIYQLNTPPSHYSQYFTYLTSWFNDCGMDVSRVCLTALQKAGVSLDVLNACYQSSFQGSDQGLSANSILEKAMSDLVQLSPAEAPSVYLWGQVYSGELIPSYLERALCSISLNSLPSACPGLFCSANCWPDMQQNSYCDLVCNTTSCSYDNQVCLHEPSCVANCTSPLSTNSSSSGMDSKTLASIISPVVIGS